MAATASPAPTTGFSVSDDVELEVELLEPRRSASAPDDELESDGEAHAFAILVVDDDVDLRRYVRRSLKRPGHADTVVLEAGDAREEIRRSLSPDRLPILVMTGERSWREASSEASRAGAQAVLSKPFNARKLCDVVARLLGARTPTVSDNEPEIRSPEDI